MGTELFLNEASSRFSHFCERS